jgi:hypothetical protein
MSKSLQRDLIIHDTTDPSLSWLWALGSKTVGKLPSGRQDVLRVAGPADLRDQLIEYVNAMLDTDIRLRQVAYWGHGSPGILWVADCRMDLDTDMASLLRPVLAGPESIFWARVCSFCAGENGQAAALDAADAFGCRFASFTHIIHAWQSGLHVVDPGQRRAGWPTGEGNGGSAWSTPWAPNTVLATRQSIPAKYL